MLGLLSPAIKKSDMRVNLTSGERDLELCRADDDFGKKKSSRKFKMDQPESEHLKPSGKSRRKKKGKNAIRNSKASKNRV